MPPIRVLFVCIHNSARSQMAEAFLKTLGGGRFVAESAGLESGTLNPVVVQAMKERGIDISGNRTKSVDDVLRRGAEFDYVVTVCDETSAERCPMFPGPSMRLHWGFPDPSGFQGSAEERLARTREVRDMVEESVRTFTDQMGGAAAAAERRPSQPHHIY